MQFKSFFALMAAGLAFAAEEIDQTLTSTSTMTQTVTITQCNPTVSNCPGFTTTSSSTPSSTIIPTTSSEVIITTSSPVPSYPVSNSTVPIGPTGGYSNSSSYVVPSSKPPVFETSTVVVEPTQPNTAPSAIPTAAAAGVFVQSGLLLSVLGAGVALLA